MNRLKFFFLCSILGLTSTVFAQNTLESCLELAEKSSPQAQLLPLVRDAEQLQLSMLRANFMPQSTLGGSATWQSAVTSLPISLPNIHVPTLPKDQYKASLEVSQNVWDGGMTKSQMALARSSAEVELKSIETSLYQQREQVANLYFGAILAKKQLSSLQIMYKDVENQRNKVLANIQNGTAVKGNELLLEAKLLELIQQTREVRAKLLAALKALSILTGTIMNETIELKEPIVSTPESNEINRPEWQVLEAQSNLLEANKNLIRAKYSPKVSLFATSGYGRPALNMLSPDFRTFFIGGLSVKIPLSHLYLKSKQQEWKQISLNQQKIKQQQSQVIQQSELKLASQSEELAKLKEQLNVDEKLIEIRAYLQKTAEKKLENGVITMSEYLTELDNELLAKQNLSLHQVQYYQLIQQMKFTLGK